MLHAGTKLRRALIFIHRWIGVGLCLVFSSWFASGIVLIYWNYPNVTEADRLKRAPILDAARIRISPLEAYTRLKTKLQPDHVKLGMFDGRPAYRFHFDKTQSIVYADDGQIQTAFPPGTTLAVASSWTGEPPVTAKVEENAEEDQWTLSGQFRLLRPLRKYTWPNGEEVYVSTVTGEVVQYTTRASRVGAYFGAVPHWLYFTSLRKHPTAWTRIVIWASGLGTATALLGIIVGVSTYSPSKRFRRAGGRSSLPYTGQKRWHSILGLIFGLLACSWTFSGMLSMDPFPQLQGETWDATGARLAGALRGRSLQLADFSANPREALAQLVSDFQVKQVESIFFAGEPVYLATGEEAQSRIIPLHGATTAEFDRNKIIEVIRTAAQPYSLAEVRLVTGYEAYYLDRFHRLPLPVLCVQLGDKGHSMYYIDPKTAQIVQSYDSRSRWNRWLYHGLHSLDVPWLYNHRPAWDIVILALMAGGLSLSVTSVLLALEVLQRKLT